MPSMRTGHDGGSWADKGLVGGGDRPSAGAGIAGAEDQAGA